MVEEALRPDTTVVSIMHVNNELGTLNPIQDIGELCRKNKVIFHVDAAQSAGKTRCGVNECRYDVILRTQNIWPQRSRCPLCETKAASKNRGADAWRWA